MLIPVAKQGDFKSRSTFPTLRKNVSLKFFKKDSEFNGKSRPVRLRKLDGEPSSAISKLYYNFTQFTSNAKPPIWYQELNETQVCFT